MRPLRRAVTVGTILLALARPAVQDAAAFPLAVGSWRCGAYVVGEGQTTGDVWDRCGEPAERTATTEFVTIRVARDVAVTRAVPVETWIYDRGPRRFVRYLTFRDGILVAIDEGSYGN